MIGLVAAPLRFALADDVCDVEPPTRAVWTQAPEPELEVDVAHQAAELELEFLLDLPGGRHVWRETRAVSAAGPTLIPLTLPAALMADEVTADGLLTVLAWQHDPRGVRVGSDGSEPLFVHLEAGAITVRPAPEPVEGEVVLAGMRVAVVDLGLPAMGSDTTTPRGRLADELEVDSED